MTDPVEVAARAYYARCIGPTKEFVTAFDDLPAPARKIMSNGLRAALEAVGSLDSADNVDHAFRAGWAAHKTEYGGRLCGCEEALKAFQADRFVFCGSIDDD